MNPSLQEQRCFNHLLREAVARCPECRHFFCRECITEHDDRVICAACLAKLGRSSLLQRRGAARIVSIAQCAFGVMTAWFFFNLIGDRLLTMPAAFHEATLWRRSWLDNE